MDEQNILESENICEPHLESSKISAENSPSGLLLSAQRTQAANLLSVDSKQRSAGNVLLSVAGSQASGIELSAHISAQIQRLAGDSNGQQHVAVSSSDRKRLDESISDESCINRGPWADAGKEEILGDSHSQMHVESTLNVDVECTSSSQHKKGVYESTDERPGNSEIKQDAALHTNQQVNAFASADSVMMPGALDDAVGLSTDEQVDVDHKGISMHLDGVQQAGATDLVHDPVESMTDEGCQGEASLEMLSMAVESFENMQRESDGCLGGAAERTVAGKELLVHDIEHDAVEAKHHLILQKCGLLRSSGKKSVGDSEDTGSFIFDNYALGKELQNKDHFLSLLYELAAVQQQEQELSGKCSDSCAANFVENEASGEPRKLSFVDLLRKQMVQAGPFTELTADAFYEQFLRQNQAILGTALAENLNPLLPSTGISSNDGDVTALETDQFSNENLDKEGGAPSNDEVTCDSEAQDEVGGCSTGDDGKIRGEEKKLGVGDLVWAKVKSHPWWPGQIFNAADASAAAKKIQRPGRTLVAFFGDGTFGWLQPSQLIAFRPNFEEKVKQTTMKSFCRAVAEALNEVSRRTELGLRCSHSSDALYSKDTFPDLNAGMRKGVRIKRHQDIRMSRGGFEPKRVLEFVQTAARLPWYSLRSGLEYTELCGHVYGFRNFMLSPKKPRSKIVPQNMLKVQNKLKPVPSSSLKRRLGRDETDDDSTIAQGKEAKRLHVSKDMMIKEQHAGNRAQSPKFRTIKNLLLTELDEKKLLDNEVKSLDNAKGSTWLAKGKRMIVSQDCKEGKRVKGWHSLGPLGGLADSGAADNVTSTDDDSKTLLDITGYHSLKRKKKGGALKCITDMVSKKAEQLPVEAREEHLSNKSLIKLEKCGEEEGNFPDSSTSSLSTVVPDHNLSVSSMTKDLGIAEESDNVKEELPDLIIDDAEEMEKGNRELLCTEVFDAGKIEEDEGGIQDSKVSEGQEIEGDKGEGQNLRDTDAEEHETEKGEPPNLKVGGAKESEEVERKLLDGKVLESSLKDVDDYDNILKKQTKCLHSHSQEHVREKGELPDMKAGDAEENEKDEGAEALLQDAKDHDNMLKRKKQHSKHLHSHSQEHEKDEGEQPDPPRGSGAEETEKDKVKIPDSKELESVRQDANDHDNMPKGKQQQTKRSHSQDENTLIQLAKARKRKQDTCEEGEKQPSPSPKNEHLGSKRSVKSSKLGASIKKVADTLKGTPAGLKVVNDFSAKGAASAMSIESEAKKHLKSPRLNQSPAFKNSANENFHGSFAKLLNNLQAIAKDPLSSANMKSSLHGVMSTFLKFRSMVFLKSSGYGAAGARKLMSSCSNGHLYSDKKTDDTSGSGKHSLHFEKQKSHVTDSSEERKSIVKAEPPSESVGPGSQRLAVQDSLSEMNVAAVKKPSLPSTSFGSQKYDLSKTSITGSGEIPICPKNMTSVQELAVAARKKKSEVLKEYAAKVQVKNEVLKGQNLFKEKIDKEKCTDARHHAKSVKHHISRGGETLSLPERKSPMCNSVDVKVAQTSLGLFMQFPEDFTLPSEAQLKEIFNPFGILEISGIRVNRNASTAQVVFKHSTDAEAAWQHARKNRMFGHANVSYRLRHFSLSSKRNSKYFEIASAKNGLSAEAVDVQSPLVENHGRPHLSRSSVSSGVEQGGSTEAAHSPATLSRAEPMDSRMSAHSPVSSISLSKAEPVHSPVTSTLLSWAEPGGVVPEPSPVPILSHVRAEPVFSTVHSPVSSTLLNRAEPVGIIVPEPSPVPILSHEPLFSTVTAPVGNFSISAEQGVSTLPASASVFQKQEALPSLSSHVPVHSNLFSLPSVSNVNVQSGDIQDQMLKLLQQVSVIVSSSTFTPRAS